MIEKLLINQKIRVNYLIKLNLITIKFIYTNLKIQKIVLLDSFKGGRSRSNGHGVVARDIPRWKSVIS